MKKIFLSFVMLLACVSMMAETKITVITDLDKAAKEGTIVSLRNASERYLFGSKADAVAMGTVEQSLASTNSVTGWKLEKVGSNYRFAAITPAGAQYIVAGSRGYLNAGESDDDPCFIDEYDCDIDDGSTWEITSDGFIKNVGNGFYLNGYGVSPSRTKWQIVKVEYTADEEELLPAATPESKPASGYEWTENLITNGDLSGSSLKSFYIKSADDYANPTITMSIVNDMHVKALKVVSNPKREGEAGTPWDSQVFFVLDEKDGLKEGDTYYVSFSYRADAATNAIAVQSHNTPGTYNDNNSAIGNVSFATTWQTKSVEGVVSSAQVKNGDLLSFAFNLNDHAPVNNYYFTNVVIKKLVKSEWVDVDIAKIKKEGDLANGAIVPTVADGVYTYTPTSNLQFAFKELNFNVQGYDKVKLVFAAPTPDGWAISYHEGQGFESIPAGSTEYVFDVPANGTIPQLALFSGIGGTPGAIKLAAVKMHIKKDDTPESEIPAAGDMPMLDGYKWVSMIDNGDFKTDNLSNFPLNASAGGVAPEGVTESIIDGPDGYKVLKVTSRDMVSAGWDSQVFFRLNEQIPEAGTQLYVSFAYKADNNANIGTQSHSTPGNYSHYEAIGTINFTGQWKRYTNVITLSAGDMVKNGGFGAVAFNLNDLATANTYYIADVRIMKLVKDESAGPEVIIPVEFKVGGQYYIQNVENGMFLTYSNSNDNNWGTRGSVTPEGILWTVGDAGNGEYTLRNDLGTASNQFLGDNGYVDSPAQNIQIKAIKQDDGEIVYSIKDANGYWQTNNAARQNLGYDAQRVGFLNKEGKWRFLTKQQAIQRMEEYASETNPVDATFLITNPGFTRNMSTQYWTAKAYSSDGTATANANDATMSGGSDHYRAAESWTSSNGFDIFQTLTGIPDGTYKLKAQVAYTPYQTSGEPYLYANNTQTGSGRIAKFSDDTYSDLTSVATAMGSGSFWTPEITAEVQNGTLRIGVRSKDTGIWCIMDNFSLTYYGNSDTEAAMKKAKSDFEEAYKNASREASSTAKRNADVAQRLKDAVEKYKNANYTEPASYRNATTALNNATSAAQNSTTVYTNIDVYNKKAAKLDNDGKAAYASTQQKYDEGKLESVQQAIDAYRAAVLKQTTPGSNFTDAIINPAYDDRTNGWTNQFVQQMGTGGYMAENGTNGETYEGIWDFMESWTGTPGHLDNGKTYQRIKNLPAGTYTLTAYILATQQNLAGAGLSSIDDLTGVNMYATADNVTLKSSTVKTENRVAKKQTLNFATKGEGDVEIGVMIENTNCNWVAFDNWTLTFVQKEVNFNAFQIALQQTVQSNKSNYNDADCQKALKEAYAEAYKEAEEAAYTDGLTNAEYTAAQNKLLDARKKVEESIALYQQIAKVNEKAAKMKGSQAQAIYAEVLQTYTDQTADSVQPFEDAYATAIEFSTGGYSIPFTNDWKLSTGNVQEWANPDGPGMAERYEGKMFTGDVMYQEITGLKNGTYIVKMRGAASYTSGRGFTGAVGKDHAYFYANGRLESLEVFDRTSIASGTLEKVDLDCVVTDGTLKFGIQNITEGANWFVIWVDDIIYESDDMNEKEFDISVPASTLFSTFIAPFDIKISDVEEEATMKIPEGVGLNAYIVDSYNKDRIKVTKIDEIPANTPVLLSAKTGFNVRLRGISKQQGVTYTKGLLTGTFGRLEVKAGYVLQKHGVNAPTFYKIDPENPVVVPAYKCWLNASSSANVKEFFIDFGDNDEETGINAINALLNGKGEIYDLNGRKLESLQKGMNIVNGVKVLVK
ncbi:MAG: RICIN domain-containing protein [Bacteroidaceae bacterium]|nr:RICIN domain-containing protein [Bacteroidaceae bacterium]